MSGGELGVAGKPNLYTRITRCQIASNFWHRNHMARLRKGQVAKEVLRAVPALKTQQKED